MKNLDKWLDENCLTVHNTEYCKISSSEIKQTVDTGLEVTVFIAVVAIFICLTKLIKHLPTD